MALDLSFHQKQLFIKLDTVYKATVFRHSLIGSSWLWSLKKGKHMRRVLWSPRFLPWDTFLPPFMRRESEKGCSPTEQRKQIWELQAANVAGSCKIGLWKERVVWEKRVCLGIHHRCLTKGWATQAEFSSKRYCEDLLLKSWKMNGDRKGYAVWWTLDLWLSERRESSASPLVRSKKGQAFGVNNTP